MKKILFSIFLGLTLLTSFGQSLVNIGDTAPNYFFTKVINSPNTEVNIADLKGKPIIFTLWGTWCGPCIPEMINLGKLQKTFGEKVQIIAVSNDNEQKLISFLQKRPSKIWFASDPSNNFWSIFNISTAGYSIVVDKNSKVTGITETHNIDSSTVAKLLSSTNLNLTENRGTRRLLKDEEPVQLDSNTIYSFVITPELKGISSMMKRPNRGAFAKRRITIVNLVPEIILREAFDIEISKKLFFASKEDSITSNKNSFCIDIIVPEQDKENLNKSFQNEVNNHLPVKGQVRKRFIPCYRLKPIEGSQLEIKKSTTSDNLVSYNGLEFEGSGIIIDSFIKFLENALQIPVYNDTNLTGYYDILFKKDNVEPFKSIENSLAKLGLELVKDTKEMDVLVISAK
jgi:thiol-disulfide isomerase/thioredoxin